MAINAQVGSVTGLWRFPVKSMRGERLEEAHVTERGLVGDRAYALIDNDTGKVVSAKSVKRFPDLLQCQATFVEPPRADEDLPSVAITLPDGSTVRSDASDVSGVLSTFFQHDVTLPWPGLHRKTSPSTNTTPISRKWTPRATAIRSSNKSSVRPSSPRPGFLLRSRSRRSSTCSRSPS